MVVQHPLALAVLAVLVLLAMEVFHQVPAEAVAVDFLPLALMQLQAEAVMVAQVVVEVVPATVELAAQVVQVAFLFITKISENNK